MLSIRLFTVVLLLAFSHIVSSAPVAKFEKIWADDGLPSRTVWQVLQDKQGLLWFATSNGLVSYDGFEFTLLEIDKDQPLNNAQVIKSLVEDDKGNLWIGTAEQGLYRYNKSDDKLDIFTHQDDKENSIVSNQILSLVSSHHSVWVGTKHGLSHIDLNTSKMRHFKHDANAPNSLPNNNIADLLMSVQGDLWVATNGGLVKKTAGSERFEAVPFSTGKTHRVKAIYQTKDNIVYAGAVDGLFRYDESSDTFVAVHQQLSGKFIYSLAQDSLQNLWVGTIGEGLYRVSPNGEITNHRYDKGNAHSLSEDSVIALLVDNGGTLWAGTFNAGLSHLDLLSLQFSFFDDAKTSLSCLTNPVIYSIRTQGDDTLWLGTQSGLAKINTNDGRCVLFNTEKTTEGQVNGLLNGQISALHLDDNNHLWVGTLRGLNRLRDGASQFDNFSDTFANLNIYDFLAGPDGQLYIATHKGLYVKHQGSDSFSKIAVADSSLDQVYISQLAIDDKGYLWLATDMGLLTLNDSMQLQRTNFTPGYDLNKPIKAIEIDAKGNLWLGIKYVGLVVIDQNGKLVKAMTDERILKAVAGFAAIVEVANGDIWISSYNGLAKINPKNWQVDSFSARDGLQSSIFIRGAKWLVGDTLYLGGRKGLTQFKPSNIQRNKVIPEVRLQQFLYFNKTLDYGQTVNEFSLPEPIEQIDLLSLSYRDHDFGFEFAAMHYANPGQNQYAYMMENWDKSWHYTSAKYRRATYSNLPAGEYVFKVKASNNHGVWNDQPKTLKVKISPPPWATPLAYTLYVLSAILVIYGIIKYRTQSLVERSRILEQSVENRTKELASEKQKVELLLSRKNEEFANVSHEFRTPLTLILGPLAQVLKSDVAEQALNRLGIVQRNAFRLLRMVDQLLNLETFRVKAITQKLPQATGKIISLIAQAFSDLAQEKHIDLTVKQIDAVNFELTSDALEKIILNLLSNAIKYAKPGDSITIESIRTSDNQLKIEVADTGIGIPADKQTAVFERYHRVLDEQSEQVSGAGIGLALVKNLVEAHQGTITLKSQLGEGTTLTVYLPIIGEVSDAQVNSGLNDEIIAMELMSITRQQSSVVDKPALLNSTNNDKPTVLVIEDNDDMRRYIVDNITENFQAITARNGEEGVARAIEEIPDLIISDVMMPKMDGYQSTHLLKTNDLTSHIPIILLTARGDRESRLKGWHQKADEYLTKPFDVEELNIRLNNLLDIRNILKKRFGETVFEPQPTDTKGLEQTQELEEQQELQVQGHKQLQQKLFVEKLNDILTPLYTDPDLAIEDIAGAFAIGQRQFFRKLKSILDMTPSEYLRRFRLEQAKILLAQGKTASVTAFEVGFSSQSYFGKCFKAQFGLSPNEFRQQ